MSLAFLSSVLVVRKRAAVATSDDRNLTFAYISIRILYRIFILFDNLCFVTSRH